MKETVNRSDSYYLSPFKIRNVHSKLNWSFKNFLELKNDLNLYIIK